MVRNKYYKAEISFFKGNPLHKYIIKAISEDTFEVLTIESHKIYSIKCVNTFKLGEEIML